MICTDLLRLLVRPQLLNFSEQKVYLSRQNKNAYENYFRDIYLIALLIFIPCKNYFELITFLQ